MIIESQKRLMAETASKNFDTLFAESEVRQMMYMIMSGLLHIHTNGVVHRDLKPENCLIDSNRQLRIIDFGLSKLSSQREIGRILLGTPHYLAPEVYIL